MVGVASATGSGFDKILGEPPKGGKTKPIVYLVTVMAVIGGFLFGYDMGIVSGAMVVLRHAWTGDKQIDNVWQQLIVAITNAAAAVFALIGGPMNDRLGRRPVIIISSLTFVIGSVILGLSQNKEMLLVGRVVLGAAIGVSSTTIPAYVAEAAPPNIRGRLITLFQLFITLGFFVAALLAAAFSYLPDSYSWKLMFGVAAIPAALQFVGFFFMPESPRWLATHDKEGEAKKILDKVCSTPALAEWELKAIELSHQQTLLELEKTGNRHPLITMLQTTHLRRALIVGCALQMFQQLSGINTVMFYSVTIIQMAGVRDQHIAIWLGSATAGVNFVCTFIGIYLVEKIGRRLLILGSMIGVISCLLLLGIGFTIIDMHAPPATPAWNISDQTDFNYLCEDRTDLSCSDCEYTNGCGFCYTDGAASTTGVCLTQNPDSEYFSINGSRCSEERSQAGQVFARGWCPSNFAWLPIIAMLIYLCSFSAGLGPMPWTINAEIYPHFARSTGCAVSTSFNWFFNLTISLTFLSLANAITKQGAYFLYAGISSVGWIVFYMIVPETKNKELEEMEHLFSQPLCSCGKAKSTKYTNEVAPSLEYATKNGKTYESMASSSAQPAVNGAEMKPWKEDLSF